MMTDALALIVGKKVLDATFEGDTKVPEPEFKPFRFPEKEAAATSLNVTPANVAREPRTLTELGVPGPLARELELLLELRGLTRGDRVVGYTFTKPDGTRYALRVGKEPARDATGLAA